MTFGRKKMIEKKVFQKTTTEIRTIDIYKMMCTHHRHWIKCPNQINFWREKIEKKVFQKATEIRTIDIYKI
jgi:hypothetical protein